jgi:subtilisin family serine protease
MNLILYVMVVAGLTVGCVSSPGPAESRPAYFPENNRDAIQDYGVHLSNDLRSQLDGLAQGEFLSVVIRLRARTELGANEAILGAASKDEQRRLVIDELRRHSAESQANLLVIARAMEADGLVRNIQPMWIANVVCLELTGEAINYLAEFQDIEYISGSSDAPLFLEDTAWGVQHINSPDVWQRAAGEVRGNGVVVAVLDSGVDMHHPDLTNRFWVNTAEDLDGDGRLTRNDENGIDDDGNGFVDDVIGWDFESGDNDPSPSLFESGRAGGHGTHVAGIIAGDGSGGTATGVAPGAEVMNLKINSQRSVWAAMQYAAANGADVLNMSIGWPRSMSPDLATWRDVVDNVTDAGVLVVTGSGSGGQSPLVHSPAPDDITIPGRVPRALTVAAVAPPAGNPWLDPVASFNSMGPVSWQSVRGFNDYPYPPGLMKPDLTAPGININSTMIGGTYEVKSGTSMAVAHVSGAAALLLEDDPSLQPHELVFQLRETAWRFTDPNDVRGWGRIDALSAVNFQSDPAPYDLAVQAADSGWQTDSLWIDNDNDGNHDDPVPGSTNRIYAKVKNVGGQTVGNVEMMFYYASVTTADARSLDRQSGAHEAGSQFNYIGSYFVPAFGPNGSSQDTFTGAVEWVAPASDGNINHWTIAVDVVSPGPANEEESERSNNRVARNSFNLVMAPGQSSTFWFQIAGDANHLNEAFDLEIVRDGLPSDFDIEFSVDETAVKSWTDQMRGFAPVTPPELADVTPERISAVSKRMRLLRNRGQMELVSLEGGRPLLARLVFRLPEIDSQVFSGGGQMRRSVTINTKNEYGIFGGLSVNIEIDPNATQINQIIYAQK